MTYISGPMTGYTNFNKEAFLAAELELNKKGVFCVNPARAELPSGSSWLDYMREDIKGLMDCDTIYMLDGWQNSKGASLEYSIAVILGYKIDYQSE